jgi:hypothetical protein
MPIMSTDRIEVERTIAAEPSAIFRVLSDPRGHVAIDSSGMLMDASGPPVTAVGDAFVVHMDREALNDFPMGLYDVTVKITTFDQDREIAWTVDGQIQPPLGHIYGYALSPTDGGTLVTSYYDWSDIDPTWREAGIFPILSEGALRATLGILARTVAGGGLPPAS